MIFGIAAIASHRIARLLASGLLLVGTTALLVLAGTLAMHGAARLGADAWLLAWGLVFAVLLPAGAVVLAAIGTLARRTPEPRTVPDTDRKIPRAGQ